MNLFPTTVIPLDRKTVAHFVGVSRTPFDCVGRFVLSAGDDAGGFVDRLAQLRKALGLRYAPLPGTWASIVVVRDDDDGDHMELRVGLDRRFGHALVRSHQALCSRAESLVAPLTIRSLALGYVAFVGAS